MKNGFPGSAAAAARNRSRSTSRKVCRELGRLPYLSVFDNLLYRLDGSKVVLYGQTIRPTLKVSAQLAVSGIEGVESVENEIEILPLSTHDSQLRRALFQAVYANTRVNPYYLAVVKPIRIIVKQRNVVLTGCVETQAERHMAGLQANSVIGVFSVTNDLRVRRRREKRR